MEIIDIVLLIFFLYLTYYYCPFTYLYFYKRREVKKILKDFDDFKITNHELNSVKFDLQYSYFNIKYRSKEDFDKLIFDSKQLLASYSIDLKNKYRNEAINKL